MYQLHIARKFDTEVDLLRFVDNQIKEMENKGEYMTFSRTGDREDMASGDKYEIVAVIYNNGKVLCPNNAGGDWDEFDVFMKGR